MIQVGASTNLVVNPGFETQSSSDYTLPANWTVVSQGQGTYPATSNWRGSWGVSGPRSGTFAYSSGNLAYGYLRSSEIVAQPGASYNLSVYVKLYRDTTVSNGTPTVRGVALDSSGTALAYFPVADTGITNSSTYKKYGGNFITPANTAKVRVELLSVMAAGWVAFDDVSLTPVPVTVIYYYAGGQRIAQRTKIGTAPDRLEYLFGDHLGSSSLVTNSSFVKTAELRYTAWGKPRSTTGAIAANAFTYTGQRQEAGIGLNFYNARWYDSNIAHFAQADTIIPIATQGTQAWNRYAYVNNNAVNYNDPTGHQTQCGTQTPGGPCAGGGSSGGTGGSSGSSGDDGCRGDLICKVFNWWNQKYEQPSGGKYSAPDAPVEPATVDPKIIKAPSSDLPKDTVIIQFQKNPPARPPLKFSNTPRANETAISTQCALFCKNPVEALRNAFGLLRDPQPGDYFRITTIDKIVKSGRTYIYDAGIKIDGKTMPPGHVSIYGNNNPEKFDEIWSQPIPVQTSGD
jgi:RHS repeat-associated protein